MIYGIRHTGIVVSDITGAINFWVDLLGFEIVSNQVESGEFIDKLLGSEEIAVQTVKLIARDESMIELLHFESHSSEGIWSGNPFSIGLTHVALNVENLENLVNQLEMIGYFPINEIQHSPNGKVKVCYIPVFEGLLLEMVETLT